VLPVRGALTEVTPPMAVPRFRNAALLVLAGVASAPLAGSVVGCGPDCDDVDLCPRPLEIYFVEELSVVGEYEIEVKYDGATGSCTVPLPTGWWILGSCPLEELPGKAGGGSVSSTAGAAGEGLVPKTFDLLADCSTRDFGISYRCGIEDIVFHKLRPTTVTITVHRDGELVLTETLTPTYRTYQPHTKGCGLPCNTATEIITTP